MDFLIAVLTALGAIELYAWLPRVAENLVEVALRRLPRASRDRFREEWAAHLMSLPNSLLRLTCALSLTLGSNRIGRELVSGQIDDAEAIIELLEQRLSGHLDQMEGITRMHQTNHVSFSSTVELGQKELLVAIEQIREKDVSMQNAKVRLADAVKGLMSSFSLANARSHDIIDIQIQKVTTLLGDAGTLIHQARHDVGIVRQSFRTLLRSPASLDHDLVNICESLEVVRTRIDLDDLCSSEDDTKSWAELERIRSAMRRACNTNGKISPA